MLRFYGRNSPAVEINYTFYRMPKASVLEAWGEQAPPDFRLVLKTPRKITHSKPLKGKSEELGYLFKTAATFGDKVGAILFQLPPYLHRNIELLAYFMEPLPSGAKSAFEFRRRSWFDDELYEMSHKKGRALCCSDGEDEELSQFVATADRGYLRLRKPNYSEKELLYWAQKINLQRREAVYVFFKHEDDGAGPKMVKRFLDLATQSE